MPGGYDNPLFSLKKASIKTSGHPSVLDNIRIPVGNEVVINTGT